MKLFPINAESESMNETIESMEERIERLEERVSAGEDIMRYRGEETKILDAIRDLEDRKDALERLNED